MSDSIRIYELLTEIKGEIQKMASVLGTFVADTQKALDNIKQDEANLAAQIASLQAQIAAGNSTLSPEDKAALDSIVKQAQEMAASVPDLPAPPPGV